ncbi:hypothetical protein MOP89_10555 [Enterococcus gallinarum]|nr:hypothetical protein [Enterococcus gallinarum]
MIRNAKKNHLQDQVLALSEQQQQRYFGHLIEDDSPSSIQKYTEQLLRTRYQVVDEQLKQNSWIDEDQFLEHYYTAFTQQPYLKHSTITLDEAVIRLFNRHLFIEKLPVASLAFLLIDEIQDYTPAQCTLLLTLFPEQPSPWLGMKIKQFLILRLILERFKKSLRLTINQSHAMTYELATVPVVKLLNCLQSLPTIQLCRSCLFARPESLPDLFVLKTSWNGWQLSHLS